MSKLIKQDINFLEYPIWHVDFKSNEEGKIFRDIEGYTYRAGYKVPTYIDVIFLYYFMLVLQNKDWKNEIKISKYNVLKNCGLSRSVYYMKRLEDSLERWINVTLKFQGIFYDNKEYKSLNFNIINDWYIDEKDKKIFIEFNKFWIKKVKESQYFKMLNFNELLKLRNPIATRLYEILIKTFQNRDTWEIDAHKLAKKITLNKKYYSHIKQRIKTALNKINKKTELKVDFKVKNEGRNKGIFVFIKKEKNKGNEKQQNIRQRAKKQKISKEEIQQLLSFVREDQKNDDIVKDIIKKYAKKEGYEYCLKNIIYTNKNSNENYKVYLLQSLENNYGEFENITNIKNTKEEQENKQENREENKNINVKYTINTIRNKKVEIEGKVYVVNEDGSVSTEKETITRGRLFVMLCANMAKLLD